MALALQLFPSDARTPLGVVPPVTWEALAVTTHKASRIRCDKGQRLRTCTNCHNTHGTVGL